MNIDDPFKSFGKCSELQAKVLRLSVHIILEDVECQLQSIVPSAPGLCSVLTWVTACMCDCVLEQALLLAGCSQGCPVCWEARARARTLWSWCGQVRAGNSHTFQT